jgi:GNAT superfamily N-acetyltransferase
VTVRIRPIGGGEADLSLFAAIANAAAPDEPTSIEDIRWADSAYPGSSRLIAELDGQPVGVASVGRIHVYPPDFDAFWATIRVLSEARRQGIGGEMLVAVSELARAAGKVALHLPASEARPEGIAFLSHRGFTEYERLKTVELHLAGMARPTVNLPDDVSLTDLATRPDLVPGVHAVAVEAHADIPGSGAPMVAGDLTEFRARDVDRPGIPADAFIVATDDRSGRVIGFASLMLSPAQPTRAWHDMTAVDRAWRGRGLAGAMKRATIGWAIEHGLEILEANNDVDNAPMRTVNARLGYRPAADWLVMRGPLFTGIMDG